MDPYLFSKVKENTPLMNKDVVNGIAVKHMEKAEEWLENAIFVVAKHFPPGFKFKGLTRCSPEQEYDEEPRQKMRSNASKSVVDVAESNVYMTYLNFELNGKALPSCPFFLPFVGVAGSIPLSGSRFFVSPVLSDIVISYEPDKIFARFTRDKFSIYRMPHSAYVDEERTERIVSWAVLYHDKSERSKSTRAREMRRVTLIHYLFIKFGFKETFAKYGKCDVEVGSVQQINDTTYPSKDWVIARGTHPTQKLFAGGSNVRIAIPRVQYEANKDTITTMLVSTFYTLDRFPINLNRDTMLEPSRYHWKITMGKSLWDTSKREAEMPDEIDKHFKSLDKYVDDLLQPSLDRIGLGYDNLYDLMAHVMVHMHKWKLETPLRSISMYNKELSVLYEIFGSFHSSFVPNLFKFYFAIVNEAIKAGDNENTRATNLTELAVMKLLKHHLKPRMVFHIRSNPANVSSMNYSGDNKFFKITSVLVRQKENARSKDGGGEALLRIHTSSPDAGSIIQLPKKNPNGQTRISPYITLEESLYVVPNPELKHILEPTQARIDAALSTNFTLRDDSLKGDIEMEDIEDVDQSD